MTYDELMKTLTRGKAYPFKGPELKTKPNIHGKSFTFKVSSLVFDHTTITAWGQDEQQVWCRREFKAKQMPKWLKQGIRNVRP